MKRVRVFHTVRSPKIPERLRFAVAADLHGKPYDDVMEDFKACDAVLVPGDLVNRHKKWDEGAARFLEEVPKEVPVFYSLGNHEWKCGYAEEWLKLVKDSDVTLLDDEFTQFRGITIGGLTSRKGPYVNTDFLDAMAGEKGFRLLMCHHPEVYKVHVTLRDIDFTVCGHAHGGQIEIFGQGLYSPGQGFLPKMTHGVHDGGRMILSRGMSNVSKAPRINNPMELLIITLEPGES